MQTGDKDLLVIQYGDQENGDEESSPGEERETVTIETEEDLRALMFSIMRDELPRVKRNLDNLDELEGMLLYAAKTRAASNRLDIKTLIQIIKTFNESVKRSGVLLQDRNSNLYNIVIASEASPQGANKTAGDTNNSGLGIPERKRVRTLLSAIIEGDKEESVERDDGES